ncbi:MAG: hypothetical protein FWH08_04980 [Oscillospiraceae bacterium]|nr:hypothetical protein [Oscillospiraceae bacterium]
MKESENKKLVYSLIIDFSFLPQIIWATLLFINIRGESPVLIYREVSTIFLVVFAEIAVLSILNIIKKFYFLRFLLIGAYLQLVFTVLLLSNAPSFLYLRVFVFAAFGIIIALANMAALYGYKKIMQKENT